MSSEPKKVLIAEDNPGLARVLAFKFKSSGFDPCPCADGQIAWEVFQTEQFSAVISDQEMPRMKGLELCKHIRSVDTDIPFFLVTGRQLEICQSESLDGLAITKVFPKPFSPGNVVAAVDSAIQEAMIP